MKKNRPRKWSQALSKIIPFSNFIPFLESAESLLFIGGLKIFLAQIKMPKKLILKNLPHALRIEV